MLKCMCDLCGAEIGDLGTSSILDGTYNSNQVRVTSGGKNIYIGDLCTTCTDRLKTFLNLPKGD